MSTSCVLHLKLKSELPIVMILIPVDDSLLGVLKHGRYEDDEHLKEVL